jgi:hypothetical protein
VREHVAFKSPVGSAPLGALEENRCV